ncbi:MAG: GcrA family cell cycle regulator [Bacteroidia bacterium]
MGAVAKMKRGTIDWSEQVVDELRRLWDEGLSMLAIAKVMNHGNPEGPFTKSAIVGKAHRLNLPARPSPICCGGIDNPYRDPITKQMIRPVFTKSIPSVRGARLPSLAAPVVAAVAAAKPRPAVRATPAAEPAQPAPVPRAVPVSPRHSCQWIFGDDTHRHRVRFCTAGAVPDKPYCAEHCARAYDGVPKRLPNVFLNYDRKVSPIRLPPGR